MQEGRRRWRLVAIVIAASILPLIPASSAAAWQGQLAPDGSQPVALVLNGHGLTSQSLRQGADVLAYQFNHQLRRFWGGPKIEFRIVRHAPVGWPVVQLLSSQRPPATGGYHANGVGGRPVAGVYLRWWGANWTVGASHELLEMFEDPAGDSISSDYLEEVCDPVQFVWYRLHGMFVSDFVTPAWFSGGLGPWDLAGRLHAPYSFARGGEEDHYGDGRWNWIGPGADMRKSPRPLKLRRVGG